MASRTLMIKALKQQLLRRLFFSTMDLCLVVVLLSAISILVTCKQCSVKEVQNQLAFQVSRSYRSNLENSSDISNDNVGSESVAKHSVGQHSLENVCPPSNSFCFPSTLSGLVDTEISAESEAPDSYGVHSSELKHNLSWAAQHSGRIISCSLYQQDGFTDQRSDDSSCVSPSFDRRTSKSVENIETVKVGFSDGFSTPPVEIKPSLLDWGHKNMYNPSVAFLSVKNVDVDSVLSVYDPYSSNSQFYPCNFSEISLAPGEAASLCFVFFPTQLGLSSAQLVLQTSFGGFLIQVKGFAVESPYLIKPLSGLDISSNGRWRKNLSLFNPFDEALYVEEITAWISTSSGNTSRSSKSICHTHTVEDTSNYNMLSAKDWFVVERAEAGRPQISLRPKKNWEIGPKKTETVVELDISDQYEGKVAAAFCMRLLRSPTSDVDTVMVPLEAELHPNSAPDTGQVSLSIEALVPCSTSGSINVALFVRNDGPYLLSVIKVTQIGENIETFRIKSVEGLVLFPGTVTQVASFDYAHWETREVSVNCKIIVVMNDTRNPMEIPCVDVISVCSGHRFDSSVGYKKRANNVDYVNGRHRFFSSSVQPLSEIKAVDSGEADESILRNWKSQATVSSMSVLDNNELLFPIVLVGNYCSQWINVKNPSQEPVVMQLILNPGQVIDKCSEPEKLLQPLTSSVMVVNKSFAPTRYGFSIGKHAVTEAFIHPYGSAILGPILFQPSNRCEWRSSALIRNNISGVEWLSLRGFGGSLSLALHEGYDPVQSLEFNLNLSNRLNFSSPRKTQSCSQPLKKEVYAKNTGDLPLEVLRIEVSGVRCGLDGFIVRNCTGFSLQPGESARLYISYQTDFSAETVQRDLELTLASGVLVIPMKATIPMCLLHSCKKIMFWMRVKKATVGLFFAASLLCLVVFFVLPHAAAFAHDQELKSGESPVSPLIHLLNSLHTRFNWKKIGPQMKGFVKSSADVDPSSEHEKQTKSLLDKQPQIASVENLDMQGKLESQNLKVKVGKEKGKRQRKKKNNGAPALLFEVSSSQSGNSTPSSPLSPVTSPPPKRPWPLSPSVEAKSPFSQKIDKTKCSPKVNILDNEVRSNCAQEKPSLTKKVAGKAVLLPSATFPSAVRAVPAWKCNSPFLAPKSTIAPHARAPGKKVQSPKNGGTEEKMAVVEQKYTYDIWGDHLFGLPLASQSKEVPSKPLSCIENDYESFFVRGPQTLMKNSLLLPPISDVESNE
ncbi:hypothetical protein ABFS83_08G047800 [Erythranthe nasuta]